MKTSAGEILVRMTLQAALSLSAAAGYAEPNDESLDRVVSVTGVRDDAALRTVYYMRLVNPLTPTVGFEL